MRHKRAARKRVDLKNLERAYNYGFEWYMCSHTLPTCGHPWYNERMVAYYFSDKATPVLHSLDEPRRGVWVHAERATSLELEQLSLRFALDLTLLTDATDPYEVPRFEVEDGVSYFYTRYPFGEGADTATAPILIAVTEDAVITITTEHPPFIDRLLDEKAGVATDEKTKLFIRIMAAIHDAYVRRLTGIRRDVQRSRVSFRTIRNSDIVGFVSIEHVLNESLGALVPTNEALKLILSGKYLTTQEEDTDLIEDVLLTNGQLIELAKTSLKTIQNIRSAYSAIMTNNLNRTIQFLTSLTIILMLPNIVSSFFGMNVTIPWGEHRFAFFEIVGLTALLVTMAIYFFKRKDWI